MTQFTVFAGVMGTPGHAEILGGHGSHTVAYPRIILKILVGQRLFHDY